MSIYNLASDFVMHTNRSIFITGKAGTGKTTFLRQLRDKTDKQMAVVAPTGVAAINAGGVTMHSFFQLPLTPFLPTVEGKRDFFSKQRMTQRRRNVIRELELLVIDEVSMVRADMMDAVDAVLRHVRRRPHVPFGGVQMVFIGDMFQLSPVVRDMDWDLLSRFYEGVYFFQSHVLREQPPIYIEFDKIFRQTDRDFIDLLNQVRNDQLTAEGYDLLQSRYKPGFTPAEGDHHITLTTHNYKADKINRDELDKLSAPSLYFDAELTGEFNEGAYPTEEQLELKVGAKVMFIKNDTEQPRRYYNGKIGTVVAYNAEEEKIYVQPEAPFEMEIGVERAKWENIRYSTDKDTQVIEEEVVGSFNQFPLRLAWAVTIHKSQGLTFDKAVIDAGSSFATGQVYVALSRCRSLEGITLLSPISNSSIRNDWEVVQYSSQQSDVEMLEGELERSQRMFEVELLQGLFDFKPLVAGARHWYVNTRDDLSSFVNDILPQVSGVIDKLVAMEEVGVMFGRQLRQILLEGGSNNGFLQERLEAAKGYFAPLMDEVVKLLNECPAATDSRKVAKEFDASAHELYGELMLKRHLMEEVIGEFTVVRFFELRREYKVPDWNFTSYVRDQLDRGGIDVEHGDLMDELIAVRNRLAEEQGVPVYSVMTLKSIREMAHFLPLTEEEMLKVHGIGKVRMKRYGAQFLEVIEDYCAMNGLRSANSRLSFD